MSLKTSFPCHLYRWGRQAGLALIIHCQSCLNCVCESMTASPSPDKNKIKYIDRTSLPSVTRWIIEIKQKVYSAGTKKSHASAPLEKQTCKEAFIRGHHFLQTFVIQCHSFHNSFSSKRAERYLKDFSTFTSKPLFSMRLNWGWSAQ